MKFRDYLTRLKIGDKLIIIVALVISLLGIIYPYLNLLASKGKKLDWAIVVSIAGEEKARYLLKDLPLEGLILEFEGPIGKHKVEMSQDGVRVIAPREDPLKICERSGWLKVPGPTIVCIPNRLLVQIVGSTKVFIDGLSE